MVASLGANPPDAPILESAGCAATTSEVHESPQGSPSAAAGALITLPHRPAGAKFVSPVPRQGFFGFGNRCATIGQFNRNIKHVALGMVSRHDLSGCVPGVGISPNGQGSLPCSSTICISVKVAGVNRDHECPAILWACPQ